MNGSSNLTRFAWLSIAGALATIGLKTGAYVLTGSVGLLSDALESLVNLVAAIGALVALSVAGRAPDEEHMYGYEKAEYFSSGLEGALILAASVSIVASAVPRLFEPAPIEQIGLGLAVSVLASVVNGAIAWRLFRAGRDYHSITLEADARHLLTDVWTSVGVVIGVAIIGLTGWQRLDPLIAFVVAANIVRTGVSLVRRSLAGLLDVALPASERAIIQAILDRYERDEGIRWHALRTRQAGRRRFVSVHLLAPDDWTVRQGHNLLETLEAELCSSIPVLTVFTHLEPMDDPASWDDASLDRVSPGKRTG
jgi:cation diffusion facilitator family transporter